MAKKFKREYTPVVIAVIILIALIGALIATLLYKGEYLDETPQSDEFIQEEMVIDNKNSKCNSKELDELFKRARKVELETKMIKIFLETVPDLATENEFVDIYADVLEVTLKNVTDDIYIKVTNNKNDNVQTLKKKDFKDGVVKFNTEYTTEVITYTIEVHANKYDCVDEIVRKFTVLTPIYNNYSNMGQCNDYPEFRYCQEFLTEDMISLGQFRKELAIYIKELESGKKTTKKRVGSKTTTTNKIENGTTSATTVDSKEEKKNNNIIYIIIGVIALGVVAIITTILVKKRRSR